MQPRDRLASIALVGAALVAWLAVGVVLATVDPRGDPAAGLVGAALIRAAAGLTAPPLSGLIAFARRRRIAYRGGWWRAARRGSWVGLLVALLVVMRLQGSFEPPIAGFFAVLGLVAGVTPS